MTKNGAELGGTFDDVPVVDTMSSRDSVRRFDDRPAIEWRDVPTSVPKAVGHHSPAKSGAVGIA